MLGNSEDLQSTFAIEQKLNNETFSCYQIRFKIAIIIYIPHELVSSPHSDILNLLTVRTLALLDRPSLPVEVPVGGQIRSGLEQQFTRVLGSRIFFKTIKQQSQKYLTFYSDSLKVNCFPKLVPISRRKKMYKYNFKVLQTAFRGT